VSQTRIKLRNHGELVAVEAFTYSDGAPSPNPALGLDREIKVADVGALAFVQELYRTTIDFLQAALNADLGLAGSTWLYEQLAAGYFTSYAKWPELGEVYQRATREFAVDDSFERVATMFGPNPEANGAGTPASADAEVVLTIDQLNRCRETQADLENFMQAVRLAVAADQDNGKVTSDDAARVLNIDLHAVIKVGRLLAANPEVCRDADAAADFSSWSFLPSYNVHFFRRANTIDDYLAMAASLAARPAADSAASTPSRIPISLEDGASLPDGVVTFLMTDVVDSTVQWLSSRSQMYAAMRRHDQLLTAAIEANGGIVLKERGEGDSFFAVFLRATDAVVAALDAQRALLSEPWTDRIQISVRMAILTGEADAQDRDYRSPAVNRCAKLRRRAVGNQVLVSETTYSIVADILRDDIHLEGHDRAEDVYVLQNPGVALEPAVAEDGVHA
jgi:class 3 adenylate cyclase